MTTKSKILASMLSILSFPFREIDHIWKRPDYLRHRSFSRVKTRVGTREEGGGNPSNVSRHGNEKAEELQEGDDTWGGNRLVPGPLPARTAYTSTTQDGRTPSPGQTLAAGRVGEGSATESGNSGEAGFSSPVNIQRLFEDRTFEGELLHFLAQRMDHPRQPPPGSSEDDHPPTYRAPSP
jgi:hypothetical protein